MCLTRGSGGIPQEILKTSSPEMAPRAVFTSWPHPKFVEINIITIYDYSINNNKKSVSYIYIQTHTHKKSYYFEIVCWCFSMSAGYFISSYMWNMYGKQRMHGTTTLYMEDLASMHSAACSVSASVTHWLSLPVIHWNHSLTHSLAHSFTHSQQSAS